MMALTTIKNREAKTFVPVNNHFDSSEKLNSIDQFKPFYIFFLNFVYLFQ